MVRDDENRTTLAIRACVSRMAILLRACVLARHPR